MQKEEFETISGIIVNDEIYNKIDKMYLDSDELDKVKFIASLKKDNIIINMLLDIIAKKDEIINHVISYATPQKKQASKEFFEDSTNRIALHTSIAYINILEIADPNNTNDWQN